MLNHESLREKRRGQDKAAPTFGARAYFGTLADACAAVGVAPRQPVAGRWVLANLSDDTHGRGDGRIKLFADGRGGLVQNWKTGDLVGWFDDYWRSLTPAEQAERERMAEEARREAEEDERRRRERGFSICGLILGEAEAVSSHPYLERKHVQPDGALYVLDADRINAVLSHYPEDDGRTYRLFSPKSGKPMTGPVLIVPMSIGTASTGFAPVSLEFIGSDGGKLFLPGVPRKGAYWLPLDLKIRLELRQTLPERIGVAEGVATVLSVSQLCRFPVVSAMCAQNMTATAVALRGMCPRADLVVLGDCDGGAEHAERAARLSAGRVLFPQFDDALRAQFKALTGGDKPTDFNDFFIAKGVL